MTTNTTTTNGSNTALLIVAWLWIGIPLLWGLLITIRNAKLGRPVHRTGLFRAQRRTGAPVKGVRTAKDSAKPNPLRLRREPGRGAR